MNNTENIRLWFLTCPTVSEILKFGTDYIGDDATQCSIYSMPTTLTYTTDIVGNIKYNAKQRLNFMFVLQAPYGDDVEQNIENLDFFDDVSEWMYTQNTNHNFPTIPEGEVISLMPVKTSFVSTAKADSAMYQMQCTLEYWRNE